MARKSIVELKADLATSFPDNITGLITPQIVRDYFTSFLDAIRPAYALISRSAPVAQALTTTDAPLVFDVGQVSDVPDFTTTPAVGTIVRLERGMTSFNLNGTVEGANGRVLNVALYVNGSITSWRASVNTLGTGKPVDFSLAGLTYNGGQATLQIQARTDAASSFTFSNMDFVAKSEIVNAY